MKIPRLNVEHSKIGERGLLIKRYLAIIFVTTLRTSPRKEKLKVRIWIAIAMNLNAVEIWIVIMKSSCTSMAGL